MSSKPEALLTLHACLDAVIENARLAGVTPASIRGVYEFPARALRRDIGDIPMEDLDVATVQAYVCAALARGYAPSTVKGKHLAVLARACALAGVPNPCPAARKAMHTALRRRNVGGPYFEPDELRDVLARVEAYSCGRPIPRRRADLAVFRLVASRGVRTGELARVRIERDIDLKRGSIVIHSKDTAHPRVIFLGEGLVEELRALIGDRVVGPLVPGGAHQLNHMCTVWQRRLGEKNLNLRVLRRSCASTLDELGAPFAVIRDVLGHVQDSAQTARYLGGSRRRRLAELRRLDEHLSPPPPPAETPS